MRKIIFLLAVAVTLVPACGNPGSSTESFTHCDFDNPLEELSVEPGSTPKPLTKSRIDRLVAGMPSEIRPDTRIILETGRALSDRAKELEGLPEAERKRKQKELARVVDNPDFQRARTNYGNYVREHCK